MEGFIESLNAIVWSNALIFLALLSGLYYSVKTRFVQIRLFKEMIRLLFKGKSSEHGVSSFQAFAIAISGRVGTGNIAGVATAIALGGPGAIFWMWVIAFVGAASAFVEASLGQLYKEDLKGEYRGGPAYYIRNGLGMKWFSFLFAIITMISMAFFLPGIQSNSIAAGMQNAYGVDGLYTGLVLVVLLSVIVFGGVKRIGKISEIVVPFMAISYVLLATVIIGLNYKSIPSVFDLILTSAVGLDAVFGGIVGMAVMLGVKRGVYSNEAGQGSAPHAASAAEVSHPAKQGLVQAFSVYIDTLFVCTATAFMILFTVQYNVVDPDGGFIVENIPGVQFGPEYTQLAIESQFPGFGKYFVAIALAFFAFTTLMAYYYMAETNLSFIDHKGEHKWAMWLLRIVLLGVTLYGSVNAAGLVWDMGDIGVGIMAWLNFLAIFLLRKPAFALLKDYEKQKSEGVEEPIFDPDSSDIHLPEPDLWKSIAHKYKRGDQQ